MEFHYQNALLPNDKRVLNDINEAARRLCDKLVRLDVMGLDISDAGKKYLGDQVRAVRGTLRRFSFILAWSLANHNIPYEEFVFVDHGGGVGVMSLLAKELGIGTVIYNDTWAPYCKDAAVIAQAIGVGADHYVQGNMDELVSFVKSNSICCSALGSYDVIEHIYDIEGFFSRLAELSGGALTVVMGSSANSLNPFIRRHHMEFQRKAEYGGRQKQWGCREDYLTRPYLVVRKEIISKHTASLSDSEVERLAKATRGLIEPDIKEIVDEYLKSGKICREPNHPTNTVNPYTGNWAERLHDFSHLREVLLSEGFEVDILPGFYANSIVNHPFKRFAGRMLNPVLSMLKGRGLVFAPFYTIYARKTVS